MLLVNFIFLRASSINTQVLNVTATLSYALQQQKKVKTVSAIVHFQLLDWNSLPSNLRQADLNLQQFRRPLKMYLYG